MPPTFIQGKQHIRDRNLRWLNLSVVKLETEHPQLVTSQHVSPTFTFSGGQTRRRQRTHHLLAHVTQANTSAQQNLKKKMTQRGGTEGASGERNRPRDRRNWRAHKISFLKFKTGRNLTEIEPCAASSACLCSGRTTLRDDFPSQASGVKDDLEEEKKTQTHCMWLNICLPTAAGTVGGQHSLIKRLPAWLEKLLHKRNYIRVHSFENIANVKIT